MTISSPTPAEAGRKLLRPRFLLALSFVLVLSWATFVHQDSSGNYGVSSFRSPRRTPKTVADRLALAEKNYQKNLEIRNEHLAGFRKGESFNPWNPLLPWWWYFQPAFTCPHEVERIGSYGDGGKWVCGISILEEQKDRKCVVYSLGVNTDSSFENEVVSRTNCDIWAFDASVDGMSSGVENNPRIHFNKVFIGDEDKVDQNGAVWKTLKTIMKENGHQWIDILKMDIEGSEFVSLNAMTESFEVLPFSQIQVEIHLYGDMEEKHPDSFGKFLAGFETLEKFHLRPFYNELNLYSTIKYQSPGVIEYSFINLAGNHYLLRD